jgi:hypothetical protein
VGESPTATPIDIDPEAFSIGRYHVGRAVMIGSADHERVVSPTTAGAHTAQIPALNYPVYAQPR